MAKKRYTAEQIIRHLREAGSGTGQRSDNGSGLSEVGNHRADILSMAEGVRCLRVDQVRAIEGTGTENGRLKKLVADQALDLAILKEASSGNF